MAHKPCLLLSHQTRLQPFHSTNTLSTKIELEMTEYKKLALEADHVLQAFPLVQSGFILADQHFSGSGFSRGQNHNRLPIQK